MAWRDDPPLEYILNAGNNFSTPWVELLPKEGAYLQIDTDALIEFTVEIYTTSDPADPNWYDVTPLAAVAVGASAVPLAFVISSPIRYVRIHTPNININSTVRIIRDGGLT